MNLATKTYFACRQSFAFSSHLSAAYNNSFSLDKGFSEAKKINDKILFKKYETYSRSAVHFQILSRKLWCTEYED